MARKGGENRGIFEKPVGTGIWWVRYVDAEGRDHKERAGPKSVAEKLYRRRKQEVREGRKFPEGRRGSRGGGPTVAEAITHYLELSPRNRSREDDLRHARLMRAAFGSRELDVLTPGEIEAWLHRRAAGVSPATANRSVEFLRRACRMAVRDRICRYDATAGVKLLDEASARTRHLSPDEETRLCAAVKPHEWQVIELAMLTGMRRDELLEGEWANVDLEARTVRVTYEDAKSKRTEYVRLTQRAIDVLQALPSYGRSRWLFPNRRDTGPVDSHNWTNRVLRPALARAGIEDFRFHDLRHTFASRLALADVPIYDIKELCRHKSVRTTEKYAHLTEDRLQESVEVLSRPRSDNAKKLEKTGWENGSGGHRSESKSERAKSGEVVHLEERRRQRPKRNEASA